MRKIQMVDTRTQYLKIKTEVDEAVLNVMDSTAFINGKAVSDFSKNLSDYLNVKYTIPCANGTDALQIALMALGLKPGDEVITPSFTYIATTEVIALLNLKPVFVDVDEKTFCINPNEILNAITSKTKAIIPVHLYGQAANLEMIIKLADQYQIPVIEDNAQAIGCDYFFENGENKKTGSIGTIGATSFYPSKNLGAFGDGGALFTNHDNLASAMQMIASHGQSKQYYHDVVGCNSRLDTIQAAILDIKLKHLNQYINLRREAADYYDKAFLNHPKIITPFRASYCNHVFHQYTILLKDVNREKLREYLTSNQIPSMIYYPVPSHKQKMFGEGGINLELPVTNWLTEHVLSIPIHTELDTEQLQYITHHILKFIN